jgi:hypothetical protein
MPASQRTRVPQGRLAKLFDVLSWRQKKWALFTGCDARRRHAYCPLRAKMSARPASGAAGRKYSRFHALEKCRTPTHVSNGSESVIRRCLLNVRFGSLFGLKSDISRGPSCAITRRSRSQSSISSARNIKDSGTSIPSVFAVVRLITSSNLVGREIGRSAGLAPLRMRSAYAAACRNTLGRSTP